MGFKISFFLLSFFSLMNGILVGMESSSQRKNNSQQELAVANNCPENLEFEYNKNHNVLRVPVQAFQGNNVLNLIMTHRDYDNEDRISIVNIPQLRYGFKLFVHINDNEKETNYLTNEDEQYSAILEKLNDLTIKTNKNYKAKGGQEEGKIEKKLDLRPLTETLFKENEKYLDEKFLKKLQEKDPNSNELVALKDLLKPSIIAEAKPLLKIETLNQILKSIESGKSENTDFAGTDEEFLKLMSVKLKDQTFNVHKPEFTKKIKENLSLPEKHPFIFATFIGLVSFIASPFIISATKTWWAQSILSRLFNATSDVLKSKNIEIPPSLL